MRVFKSLFIAIITLLFCMSLPLFAFTIEETDITRVSYNQNPIKLETPILKRSGEVYVPIRDLLDDLDAKLYYKRKSDEYELKTHGHTLILKLYDTTIKHNGKTESLANPPIFDMGRLYFPKSVFKLAEYTVSESNTDFSIGSSKHKKVRKSPPKTIEKLPVSSLAKLKKGVLNKQSPRAISYLDKNSPLDGKLLHVNNVLYIEGLDFFKQLGYNVTFQKTGLTLSNNYAIYTFFTTKPTVYRKLHGKASQDNLKQRLFWKNKKLYFPIEEVLRVMDYSFAYDGAKNIIEVLVPIKSIDVMSGSNSPIVTIKAPHPLSGKPAQKLLLSRGIFINIPGSDLPEDQFKFDDLDGERISKVIVKSLRNHTSQVRLYSKEQLTQPNISPRNDGLSIGFNSSVTTLKEGESNGKAIIRLSGQGPYDVKMTRNTKAKKLIIDINNCISSLPLTIQTQSNAYKAIRTSQFKTNPYVTRLVIDFDGTLPEVSHITAEDFLEFRLSSVAAAKPSPTKPSIKPKPALKKTPVKKPHYSKSKPLKNRVIFIDAGHGGRDPGAVVHRKYYEKTYNLDIAKRLQRRLEAEGATVILSRSRDRTLSLSGRSYLANKNNADIMVSIHINSFIKSTARGTETYYYKYKDKRLASHIQKQMAKDLGRKNNGVKRARLYILRNSRMPAALIEPVFMTNSEEHRLLKSPAFRQKIANSVYQGIKNYFIATN